MPKTESRKPTPAQKRALVWLMDSNVTPGVCRLVRFRVCINARTRKALFAARWVRVTETVDAEFVEITEAGLFAIGRPAGEAL